MKRPILFSCYFTKTYLSSKIKIVRIFKQNTVGGFIMAFKGSKGWYVQELKKVGITRHPVELRKLETYKTSIIRSIYEKHVVNTETAKEA
jgi:hypothetical protein